MTIKDSWNKTDKRDARNMAKALWIYMVTGEFGLPTIYKPSIAVRELRKLFTYYNLLNRQIRMIKNCIQALLTENGIILEEADRKLLLKKNGDNTVVEKLDLTPLTHHRSSDGFLMTSKNAVVLAALELH